MFTVTELALPLILALAPVDLSRPMPDAQTIGHGNCADGRTVEVKLFDPDPADPDAGIFEYWLPTGRIAANDVKAKLIYIDATRTLLPLEQALQKYGPSPCDLPVAPRV